MISVSSETRPISLLLLSGSVIKPPPAQTIKQLSVSSTLFLECPIIVFGVFSFSRVYVRWFF